MVGAVINLALTSQFLCGYCVFGGVHAMDGFTRGLFDSSGNVRIIGERDHAGFVDAPSVAVLQAQLRDQLSHMRQRGFDSFAVREDKAIEHALKGLRGQRGLWPPGDRAGAVIWTALIQAFVIVIGGLAPRD